MKLSQLIKVLESELAATGDAEVLVGAAVHRSTVLRWASSSGARQWTIQAHDIVVCRDPFSDDSLQIDGRREVRWLADEAAT